MTSENSEDPTCPKCGKPAVAVLKIPFELTLSTEVLHGEACLKRIPATDMQKAFVH
jgi:hypothetical protein